jgi:hypothetical protein
MHRKTLFLLVIIGIILANSVLASYNATYVAEDIPTVVTDTVIQIPVQFLVTGMFRLVQFAAMTIGVIILLVSGVKLLIQKIKGE